MSGNRVILFNRSMTQGEAAGRRAVKEALERLSQRYGFDLLVSEDPSVFTPGNLANTKAIIMSNGDGDVVPAGPYRTALQDFNQISGWGVIWIHHACAFITAGWPYGQQSCVEQIQQHLSAGTARRIFIDSGTAAKPEQGIKSPQTEFLLRNLPGWGGGRSLEMEDEWNCFQAPARNISGVNVLFGFDRRSGSVPVGCPDRTDTSEAASQAHNLAWTHAMGKGISIVNTWGHDSDAYVSNGHMGDSLLWRYIRYAAKDWEVPNPGDRFLAGCSTTPLRPVQALPRPEFARGNRSLSVPLPGAGRYEIRVTDMAGRGLGTRSAIGPGAPEIPVPGRGQFLVHVSGEGFSATRRIMLY